MMAATVCTCYRSGGQGDEADCPAHGTDPAMPGEPLQNLPPGWWDQRTELAHIRQAAQSRMLSPDAVLGAVLARVAAATPPNIHLPAVVGGTSPLSLFAALVGPSGTGKSSALAAAADLLPIENSRFVEHGLGSGEGLIELFWGTVEVEDETTGKPRTERQQTKLGALVTLDEGAALAALGDRKGSTMLATLRSMWSGGAVGQANASADRTRKLDAGRYSIGFVVGLQPARARALLSDVHAGTPQRFIWFRTSDPLAPDETPTDPGPLHWSPRDQPCLPAPLDVDQGVVGRKSVQTIGWCSEKQITRDEIDSHADLARLKIAGALAVLAHRDKVTADDWAMARTVVDTSKAVRGLAIEASRAEAEAAEQLADRQAKRRAKATAEGLDEHHQRQAERIAGVIARAVQRSDEGKLARSAAKRSLASRDRGRW